MNLSIFRMNEALSSRIRAIAKERNVSLTKCITDLLESSFAGEVTLQDRLDNLEQKLYEIQYSIELETYLLHECMRILLGRTSVMLKTNPEAKKVDQQMILQSAKQDMAKVVDKALREINSGKSVWYIETESSNK